MYIHIRIAASPADKRIHIGLRNIGGKPVKRYKFLPESVDSQLLERLAKLLVREVSQLTEVKVYGNFRDKLRHQMELEKRQNENEQAQAYAHQESVRQSEKNATLINRVRRAFAEETRRIMGLLSKT